MRVMHDLNDFQTFKRVLHVAERYTSYSLYWELDEFITLLQSFRGVHENMVQANIEFVDREFGGSPQIKINGWRPADKDERAEYRRLLREDKRDNEARRRDEVRRLTERLEQINPKLVNPDWEELI